MYRRGLTRNPSPVLGKRRGQDSLVLVCLRSQRPERERRAVPDQPAIIGENTWCDSSCCTVERIHKNVACLGLSVLGRLHDWNLQVTWSCVERLRVSKGLELGKA